MNSFYSAEELSEMGFKRVGENVLLSRKASIYSPTKISIGSNVRIDDFCILSGNITIGSNVHISAYTALFGGGEIIIEDYSGCSQRCTLISASDDFSGKYMIGAVIDDNYKNVTYGKIKLEKYVQLGANTVVMPNVTIKEGAVSGSMSLINKDLEPWTINVGVPCRKIKERSKELLELVEEYEKSRTNFNNLHTNL